MIRKIIKIDEDRCNGCGACAAACHEGAIEMAGGKAVLAHEDYCDGLGDCLPECPAGAISFEEREVPAYNEAAVLAARQMKESSRDIKSPHAGCPGSRVRRIEHPKTENTPSQAAPAVSQLGQWPCQIKLAPVNAPYFSGAELLIAADCTAYAYASIHEDFMKGRITLIGCPKLDDTDYSEKLAEIIRSNDIRSVLVLRMEVPCCGGLEMAVKKALQAGRTCIPCRIVTVSIDGKILDADY